MFFVRLNYLPPPLFLSPVGRSLLFTYESNVVAANYEDFIINNEKTVLVGCGIKKENSRLHLNIQHRFTRIANIINNIPEPSDFYVLLRSNIKIPIWYPAKLIIKENSWYQLSHYVIILSIKK